MSLPHNNSSLFAALLLGLLACSNPPPPSTPNAVESSKSAEGTAKKKSPKVADSDESTDSGIGEMVTDGASADEDEEKKTETKTSDKKVESQGAADVGDDEMKKKVNACVSDGHFFDRFTDDAEPCTKLSLAKLTCTEAGIKKILSDKLKTQWDTAVAGSYSGWKIDQCLDCASGEASGLCKNSEGTAQTGTKVFFVKEFENAELRGKSMLLPLRPGK